MKKTLSLLVALFTVSSGSLFAMGSSALAMPADKDAWKVALTLYARVVGSTGQGIDKEDRTKNKAGYGGSFRIRPGMIASNGNFVFGAQLGTDVYMGGITTGGGSNNYGYGLAGNLTNAIQLRQLYIGYTWDNGVYTNWGVQAADLPYLNADAAAGMTVGWKNDSVDVTAFYFMLNEGQVYRTKDDSALFGIKADISAAEGFSVTPFLAGLWQGADYGLVLEDRVAIGSQEIHSMNGYGSGSKFIDNVGLYAGVDLAYTAPFGLYADLKVIYLYGKNEALSNGAGSTRYNQTRNAVAGLLAIGYKLEEIMKAELFVDVRSGDRNTDRNGTNSSANGGLIQYDANVPPLLIMYNAGTSRQGFQYTSYNGDGYAFTDRGAMTLGLDANFNLSVFNVGIALGNAWFTAPQNGNTSNIGFEFDITAAYNIMNGLKLYAEGGVLVPGKGLKQELASAKGSSLKSQTPWLVNFGMMYSI